MNQVESSDLSPLGEGEFGDRRRDKETSPPFWRYALGWGFPLSLAIVFFTLGADAPPFDLIVRGLCVGLAALLGRYIMLPQTSPTAQLTHPQSPPSEQVLTVHRALTNLHLPTLLQQFVDEMVVLIPCRGALLILFDGHQEEPEYVVTNGSIPSSAAHEFPSLLPQEIFLEALEKKTVILNSPQQLQDRLGATRGRTLATHNLFVGCLRRQQHLAFFLFADRLEAEGFLPRDERAFAVIEDAATRAIDNARQFTALCETGKDHRNFLRDLVNAQEQDNKLIAEEWQNRVGNKLFEVLQGLRSFQSLILQRTPEIAERFQELTASVDESAALVRSLTNEIHPAVLEDFGVAAAIREYIADAAVHPKQDPFRVTVQADGVEQQLPSEAKLLLFRITQEALRHIRKRADVKNVQIAFFQEHSGVSLMIKDDGKGVRADLPHTQHFGLHYMKERAEAYGGTFRVINMQGQGTEVRIELPSATDP